MFFNPANRRTFRPEHRMELNLRRVAEYIRGAATEELLDRVTVYRDGMEPAALDLMEGELDRRGVTRAEIADHDARQRTRAIILPDGTAMRCSFCDRPAVGRARGWYRLRLRIPLLPLLVGRAEIPLGFSIPIFPRVFAYCAVHQKPEKTGGDANPSADPGS
jgi:hypothetical protein